MILIKYATRSRVTQFLRNMRQIKLLTVTPYKVIVSCDEDDNLMNNTKVREYTRTRFPEAKLCFGKRTTKVGAINRDMEHAGEWDVLVNYSDDVRFTIRAWDRRMLAAISRVYGSSLDFFAHFNDGYVGDRLPTVSIIGRDYWKRDLNIYHPSYKSFSCDAEAMYVAMMRRRYHYFKDIIFKHEHPANSRLNKNDILYKHNSTYSDHDTQNYFARLNSFFGETDGMEILLARPELKRYVGNFSPVLYRRGEALPESFEPDQEAITGGRNHLDISRATRPRRPNNRGKEKPAA